MKNQSYTKRGPGRMAHKSAAPNHGPLTNGKRASAKSQQRKHALRDGNGAVTLTGCVTEFVDVKPGPGWLELGGSSGPEGFTKTARRIWLAGISAQRGY